MPLPPPAAPVRPADRDSRARPVALEHVARAAGVSLATASRALRDHPDISRATCARVRLWAKCLGYRPNPLVRCLMTQVRAGDVTVAASCIVYLDFSPESRTGSPGAVCSRFLAGAEARARSLGYRLQRVFPLADRISPAELTATLASRGLRGVLLPADTTPAAYLAHLAPPLPVVAFGGGHPRLPYAAHDRYMSARLARRQVRELGYLRPGLAVDPHAERASASQLQAGFYSDSWPHPDVPVPVLTAGPTSKAAFTRWYANHRPDCVVACHARVFAWLRDLEVRIPRDTAFVLLDLDTAQAGLAGIDQRAEAVAAAAVESLATRIELAQPGAPAAVHGVLIPGVWKHGPSAPPLAKRDASINAP